MALTMQRRDGGRRVIPVHAGHEAAGAQPTCGCYPHMLHAP